MKTYSPVLFRHGLIAQLLQQIERLLRVTVQGQETFHIKRIGINKMIPA